MNDWHRREISEIVLETGTDIYQGRKVPTSDRKRKKHNRVFILPSTDTASIIKRMASDASLSLLTVAYLIAAFVGDFKDNIFAIILIAVAFICGSYIKYQSSLRITNSYRLLLPEAKIIENGIKSRLSLYDVEVGDLITFSQGDIIPADARLVTSSRLLVAEREINEYNGRSEYKRHQKDHTYVSNDVDGIRFPNMVYAGSMVISGKGSAIVSAIGKDTLICQNHDGISIVPEDDSPEFFKAFLKKSRRFSLLALTILIPTLLLLIYLQTVRENSTLDFMSMFILALAVSATSMSELSISSAEAIITKELLPSSLISKIDKTQETKITKLSSAEKLAETDSVLILTPEVLIDERCLVRRVYFSGRQYRFDSLYSEGIKDFLNQISPFYYCMPRSAITQIDTIVSKFLDSQGIKTNNHIRPKFVKNFPIEQARTCIFEYDSSGAPKTYLTKTTDISLLSSCTAFRTDGGSLWKLDTKDIENIQNAFDEYSTSSAIQTAVFFSYDKSKDGMIFEGIVAIGEEYPYSDKQLLENLSEADIHPILILEEENQRNLEIARNCGLYNKSEDIAVCSEYQKNGLTISDAHLSTKIYVGFGRKGTQFISNRLSENSRKALPIIKDSANRRDVAPYDIYATHSSKSLDSVKIASSISIIPTSSGKIGGVADVLKAVQASSMAFLKLGVFKNYLVFSSILRILTVCMPLIAGYTGNVSKPLALLACGFFGDFIALISIAYFKGIPVKAKNIVSETKKLFYFSTSLVCSFCSLIMSVIVICLVGYLTTKYSAISSYASFLTSIFIFAVQMAAIGGFLLILHGKTRAHKFNFCYTLFALIFAVYILCTLSTPKILFILPYLLTATTITVIITVLIVGNLSSFASTKQM